ncbi:hypothetical protein BH23THE1_BH23THE1_15400 [soil metagenome]
MYLFTMSENKDNKKTENHKENLVEITNEYNENGRPRYESESILDVAMDRAKSGTKVIINKVNDTDKNLGYAYNKNKTIKIITQKIKYKS